MVNCICFINTTNCSSKKDALGKLRLKKNTHLPIILGIPIIIT